MDASLQARDDDAVHPAAYEPSLVAGDGRGGEVRDVRIRNGHGVLGPIGEIAQARAEDDAHLRGGADLFPDRFRGLLDLFEESHDRFGL